MLRAPHQAPPSRPSLLPPTRPSFSSRCFPSAAAGTGVTVTGEPTSDCSAGLGPPTGQGGLPMESTDEVKEGALSSEQIKSLGPISAQDPSCGWKSKSFQGLPHTQLPINTHGRDLLSPCQASGATGGTWHTAMKTGPLAWRCTTPGQELNTQSGGGAEGKRRGQGQRQATEAP